MVLLVEDELGDADADSPLRAALLLARSVVGQPANASPRELAANAWPRGLAARRGSGGKI